MKVKLYVIDHCLDCMCIVAALNYHFIVFKVLKQYIIRHGILYNINYIMYVSINSMIDYLMYWCMIPNLLLYLIK